MRIAKISAFREVQIKFTNALNFPSTEEFIKLNTDDYLLSMFMLSGETQEVDKNLSSWTILSVTENLITVKLEFEEPI